MKTKNKKADLILKNAVPWLYSKNVKEHFFHPKNFMKPEEEKKFKFNAYGEAGSAVCGDMMKFWLWIDPKTEKIKKAKWRTFGCGSAIASTSVLSVMITEKGGITIKKASLIKPQDIIKRLGGLPSIKIHCSVLGDEALKEAIENYYHNKKLKSKRVLN